MSAGAAPLQPHPARVGWRPWSLPAALVVLLIALAPPLAPAARHSEYAQALQFALLAIVVPALAVLGAPWPRLGLARKNTASSPPKLADTVADRRRRHRELPWSLGFIALDLAAAVAWHTPAAVAASVRHWWMAPVAAIVLLGFGIGLWLELVESPPLSPRSGYLRRAVLAAFVMWAFWILAYVSGLSTHDFYRSFHHVGGGLSAAADQQIASAVLWFVATVAFVPLIFWNAFQWLKTEEDPDTELLALARDERRRGPHQGAAPVA